MSEGEINWKFSSSLPPSSTFISSDFNNNWKKNFKDEKEGILKEENFISIFNLSEKFCMIVRSKRHFKKICLEIIQNLIFDWEVNEYNK